MSLFIGVELVSSISMSTFWVVAVSFFFIVLFLIVLCRVIEHCIKKRLLWNTCFACKVCKEGEYYEDMMRYLRKNLAVSVDGFTL